MAESSKNAATQSVTVTETTDSEGESQRVVLKLKKPKTDRKVQWEEGTVDNEFMDKKKSKCCCIYEKPRIFGESSSEDSDDDDCSAHCRGHKKKCHKHDSPDGASGSSGSGGGGVEGGMAAS